MNETNFDHCILFFTFGIQSKYTITRTCKENDEKKILTSLNTHKIQSRTQPTKKMTNTRW